MVLYFLFGASSALFTAVESDFSTHANIFFIKLYFSISTCKNLKPFPQTCSMFMRYLGHHCLNMLRLL